MMNSLLHPSLVLIVGALLIPVVRGKLRSIYLLGLPVLSLALLIMLPQETSGNVTLLGYDLVLLRIDRLSFVFALIFHIAAILATLYALHVKDTLQHVSAMIYAAAAIGATLAGDLVTLFIWWEITAVASVFLIWASRTERAFRAGMRYLIIQISSGLLLLVGVLTRAHAGGGIEFAHMSLQDPGALFIFLAFGMKCAFPLLHNWLEDSYPEATVTGAVVLSAFTTKLAVYALARSFAGTEILVWIGAVMVIFPLLYAALENDLRRCLTYVLNNQLGFMVVGIGVGTDLALNGTAAHAFCHIIYKALLFMSMGAVLLRTGTAKASELGGLYKFMPYTTAFCIVGGASIAFPLFCSFVSKSMILTAVAVEHRSIIWLVLLFASAGAFLQAGVRIPFRTFFDRGQSTPCEEAPGNMLWAMGIAAFLCVGIGVYPAPLYAILPFEVDFAPYTATHVITQLQLMFFTLLAFAFLVKTGWHPRELRAVNLDTDWIYRRFAYRAWANTVSISSRTVGALYSGIRFSLSGLAGTLQGLYGPHSELLRGQATGTMALWAVILLCVILIFSYI